MSNLPFVSSPWLKKLDLYIIKKVLGAYFLMIVLLVSVAIVFDISDSGFKKKAFVDECIGYDPQNDCFLVLSDSHLIDSTVIGCFPRYSLNDLIQKASEIMS